MTHNNLFDFHFSVFFFTLTWNIKFRSNRATKKSKKKSIPDSGSSILRDYLINANLSGIVRWSYLFFFFLMIFFFNQPLSQREPNGFTGRLVPPNDGFSSQFYEGHGPTHVVNYHFQYEPCIRLIRQWGKTRFIKEWRWGKTNKWTHRSIMSL